MRILAIGAHPADCFDLAGGTLYRYAIDKQNDITIMAITDGVYSHTVTASEISSGLPYPITVSVKTKRNEVMAASNVLGLGIKSFFGRFDDEPLLITKDKVDYVIDVLRTQKPDLVLTHHPNEYAHWDHSECGKIVCRALKATVKRPGTKHWVRDVYFYATQFRPEAARLGYVVRPPDVLIALGREEIERKVKAMCCFKSQGHDDEDAMWRRMNSWESEMGRAEGLEYAEGFVSYYPLRRRLLPTSDVDKAFYVRESDKKSD